MKDPITTIGQILDESAQRDAIHICIFPAISDEDYLHAGCEVGLAYGTTNLLRRKSKNYDLKPIGIVDPFLRDSLKKGERCWVFLFPNSVIGMRHHWEHPEIDHAKPLPTNESELWLRHFADKWNMDYDEMIASAIEGSYATAQGVDLHSGSELDDGDEFRFWEHIEKMTGKTFSKKHKVNFTWSCSC